jgi:DNA-binding NarL/FixJ family response regulator
MSQSQTVQVLLANHQPILIDGLRLALCNTEFTIAGEATTGEVAVALASRLRPEMIVLDPNLPDISGFEVLRQLTERGSLPCVLIFADRLDREATCEAIQLGARGVIAKDVTSDLLLKSMRAVWAGEYWVGRQILASVLDVVRKKSSSEAITRRERQIMERVLGGMTNRQVAEALGISEETVKRHVRNL